MKIASFQPDGGPLSASVESGHAQTGAFTFILWESGSNTRVIDQPSDFNGGPTTFTLPQENGSNTVNNGRVADVIASIVITPPITDYSLTLSIFQNGTLLQSDTALGSSDNSVETQLRVSIKLQVAGGGTTA